jgi:hypothetical protein
MKPLLQPWQLHIGRISCLIFSPSFGRARIATVLSASDNAGITEPFPMRAAFRQRLLLQRPFIQPTRNRGARTIPTAARSSRAPAGDRGRGGSRKCYEADPLVCPRCSGPLTIISLIGDAPVIEKILRHLKLWDRPERPPPQPAGRSIEYDEKIANFDEAG